MSFVCGAFFLNKIKKICLQMISWVVVIVFLGCQISSKKPIESEREPNAISVLGKPEFLPGVSSLRVDLSSAQKERPPHYSAAPAPPGAGLVKAQDLFIQQMDSLEHFEAFSTITEGFIKGAAVKFFIDRRSSNPQIYFINGNYLLPNGERPQYSQFHYYFAQHVLQLKMDGETFNQHTYFTNDLQQKQFIAGTLQKYDMLKDGQKQSYLGIQFYPQDYIAEESLLTVLQSVKKAISINSLPMLFVSYGSQQTFAKIKKNLTDLSLEPTTVDQIYSGISYIPMHQGETYGYLRFQTLGPSGAVMSQLSPQDIPVFNELPLDLSVVSGVITTVVQDAGAHVNLKSKERNTPNMVLKDSQQVADLKKYDQKPVHLVVGAEAFKVDQVTDAVVKKYFNDKNKTKKWIPIKNGTQKEFLSFDVMGLQYTPFQISKMGSSYGGKGSKLGFLASPKIVGLGSDLQKLLNYRLTPIGFAMPVDAYFSFVKSNPQLQKMILSLAQAEMSLTGSLITSAQREQKVAEIQKMFYSTPVPSDLAQKITEQINLFKETAQKNFPLSVVNKVKIRSSANAEDIPQFDGAGLHSSYSAKVDQLGDPNEVCQVVVSQDGVATKEDIVPETIFCAVKGVMASLWNKRAIEERNYARIDQRSVAMGIAVNNAYDFRKKTESIKEIANAVLVTRVINSKGVYGYRLSINTDENLVTNPTPGTQAEILVASFIDAQQKPQLSYLQYAKTDAQLESLKAPLLKPADYNRMLDIAKEVEKKYCREIPTYYPQGSCDWVMIDANKPSALDMEFKIYSNGEVLIKQVREFSGQ